MKIVTFKRGTMRTVASFAMTLLWVLTMLITRPVISQAGEVAEVNISASGLTFFLKPGFFYPTVSISGPDGIYFQREFSDNTPYVPMKELAPLSDGWYSFEISVASNRLVPASPLNDGRGEETAEKVYQGVSQSGGFRIVNGTLFQSSQREEQPSKE